MPVLFPGKVGCSGGGSLRGAEPHLMRVNQAFDQVSRCDASLISCRFAAENTTRGRYFDTSFGQEIRRASFPNVFSILLEWGCRPLKLPRRCSLPLLDAYRCIQNA